MRPEPSLTIISLGGGVQSSVMTLMASRGRVRPRPGLRHLCRHALGAAHYLHPPGMAGWAVAVSPARRGQRAKPQRGREGPQQPLGLPKLRRHPRLPQGTRRRGRRHRQAPVHRQLQDKTHPQEDTRLARTQTEAASPVRRDRRALARHLHRRGHTHEDVTRQVDNQPLPAHRGGDVPGRTVSTGGLHATTGPWNAPPASPAPSSHASVGWRRSAGGRTCSPRRCRSTPTCGTPIGVWPSPRSLTCTPAGCPLPRRSASTRRRWDRTGRGTASATSARGHCGV